MGQFKLKFEIGEIEFEAEGTYEEVERERKIFVEQILPLVANINVAKVEEPEVEVKEEIKALAEKVIVPPTVVNECEEVSKPAKKTCKKKKNTKK